MNKLIILESPFAGNVKENIKYARRCMRDCFMKGEYPFASHLLYTQEGVLDDNEISERNLGINAGLEWGKHAFKTVVYTDLGISKGMKFGIELAKKEERTIEYRKLHCSHDDSYPFHENAPDYCPTCKTFLK